MIHQHIRRITLFFLALLMIFVFMPVGIVGAEPMEKLLLTGFVKRIEDNHRSVTIQVTSLGCEGTRTYALRGPSRFRIAAGNKVEFYIDSPDCGSEGQRTITGIWKVKSGAWRIR